MNILVAGGTGFVGRYLINALLADNHAITVLGRDKVKIKDTFNDLVNALQWEEVKQHDASEFDVIINLTGQNIGERRWSKSVKKAIKDSRVVATQFLAEWCAKAKKPPHIYNASAIGIYGLQPINASMSLRLTEAADTKTDHKKDFLSEVGRAWEEALTPAITAGAPVTIMRFAPVLKRGEGVLKKLEPVFNARLGGRLGSGRQAFSWVYIDDLVRAIQFLLNHPQITGPVNISAPECVMQKTFAKTLAKVMHRQALLWTPGWVLQLVFGRMAKELLLSGQNMYPARLLENGFDFAYPTLEAALQHDWQN